MLALASCAGNLDLAIDLRTDLVPGVEFDAVRITVDGATQPLVSAPLNATVERGVRVFEEQLAPGRHLVNVTLMNGAEEVVGRNYVIQLERSLIFAAVLTRDCRGVECPGAAGSITDSECLGGRCVDPACDEPGGPACPTVEPDCRSDADCESTIACVTPICASGVCLQVSEIGACPAGEYCDPEAGCAPIPVNTDAGVPDAGVPDAAMLDAGIADAGSDANVDAGCTSASQCDDGIGCTVDACDAGDCTHTGDDASCGGGSCDPAGTDADPTTGCVPEGPCRGRAAGFVCRASRGACDVEETCDGTSIDCPTDAFESGTCRPSAGTCDVAEVCTGVDPDCPADALLPSTTTCRAASDVCDRAETCTGASATCPTDTFLPSSTTCRASTDLCDRAEMCSGTGPSCPTNTFLSGGTVCRPVAGLCDTPEVCSGGSASCPVDAFLGSSTVCRASVGICDVAESCSGSSAACPTDVLRTSSTTCRTSAGVCDVPEVCNGVSPTCPINGFAASTTVCRTAFEACDAPEQCTGTAALCPGEMDLSVDGVPHPVTTPGEPVLFDLDADMRPELLVRSGPRNVVVWHGAVGGGFETPMTYTYPDPISHIALADLDRDGNYELLVSTRDVVTMRRGTTGARFTASTVDSVPLGGPSGALAVGDFDADGVIDDVMVLTSVEAVSLRGDGLMLTQADKYPLAGRMALAVGDVDRDGRPDVVIGGDDVFDTLRGLGMGRFSVATQPIPARIAHVLLATLTCDDVLTAVVDDVDGRVVVLVNEGGNFTPRPGMSAGAITGLGVGDVNQDGVGDLVSVEPGLGIRVFFGRGNGMWNAGVRFDYPRAALGVVVADLDRDGRPDVVVSAADGVDALRQ